MNQVLKVDGPALIVSSGAEHKLLGGTPGAVAAVFATIEATYQQL